MEELVTQLLSLVKGIWKYRWYAAVIAWVVALGGWITVYTLRDNYQASARVFVDTQSILKPLLSGMTSLPNVEQQVSIMSRTLLSRPNVERVMRMVDMDIKTNGVKEHEKQVDDFMSKVKIGGTIQNDIYTITFNDENPRVAKDVVQSLLTIFVEGSLGNKKQDSTQAVHFIDDQIKAYEEKLTTAENALKDFKLKNMGLLPRQGSDYGTKLSETSDTLTQARLELMEAEQARNAIKRQIDGGDDATGKPAAAGTAATTPLSPEMDNRIQALNKNLDALRLQFTEQHPDIVATKRLIAQLEARNAEEAKTRKAGGDPGASYSPMLQQLKVALAAAEAKVASMRARVDEYTARVSRLKTMSVAAPEVETELAQLNRDYQINRENYAKLVASRESAKLSGELTANTDMMTFRIIDPPTVPLSPNGPNRLRLYSLVLLGALVAGTGAAVLMSKIRPTFVSQNNLRDVTGLQILGSVSMNWTEHERKRRKRSLYAFELCFAFLLVLYGGVMVVTLLKP